MSEAEETAKAAQEAAKFGQEVVKHLPEISEVGSKLLGPFGEGWGILTDLARHAREEIQWRLENRRRVYQRASEMLQAEGVLIDDVQPVSPRIAYDVEAHLEREDIEELQELWAALIANLCIHPSDHLPLKIVVDVLSRMDRDTALFFNEIAIRKHQVRSFFIVAGSDDGRSQIVGILYRMAIEKPVSTALFEREHFSDDGEDASFICKWPISSVELIVDALCSLGVLRRTTEQYQSTETFKADEEIEPSQTLQDLGIKVIQNISGVDAFELSELGRSLHSLVSPPTT